MYFQIHFPIDPPKPIRDGMNLNPGDKITIVVENDKICIKKTQSDTK
jgi:AbrB family looped-hinge helix DNA binding protein